MGFRFGFHFINNLYKIHIILINIQISNKFAIVYGSTRQIDNNCAQRQHQFMQRNKIIELQ